MALILDSSGSLRREYRKEKDFVKQFADILGISKNGTRIGVITFSRHAEHSIKLDDYDSTQGFQEAVDRIPIFGHTTRIDKALKLARDSFFRPENGSRLSVPKLTVLLTDGSQTRDIDAEDPGVIAAEMRADKMNFIVIGIGNRINEKELQKIANEQSSLFLARNFDQLISSSFLRTISKTTCKKGKNFETKLLAKTIFINILFFYKSLAHKILLERKTRANNYLL